LPDGGAGIFAATVAKIRELVPTCSIELLVPDFQGSSSAIESVTRAKPDILNHNLETVPRLYRTVRPGASYRRSLELLRSAKMLDSTLLTKSGLMVGLGETWDEIERTMADLHDVSCDILTIGQYLQPSAKHLAVERYYEPAEFGRLREAGLRLGFRHVEAGALVRSSYHAFEQIQQSVQRDATDQA
jgi:lipoic acid synthetase